MATPVRSKNIDLTRADTERFISYYQSHECLWLVSSPFYSKREHRQAAYTSIAELVGDCMTADQVPVKISALRTYYDKELKKEPLSRKSGAGVDDIYESTWDWFKLLDPFLRSQVQQKATISNLETNILPPEQDGPSQAEQVVQEEENVGQENAQTDIMDCTPAPPSKKQRQDSVPLQVLATLKAIENRKSRSENNGELCFAKYLASEMAQISNIWKRNALKIKIQELIFENQLEE